MIYLILCVPIRTPDGNAVCYELEGEATPPEAQRWRNTNGSLVD